MARWADHLSQNSDTVCSFDCLFTSIGFGGSENLSFSWIIQRSD